VVLKLAASNGKMTNLRCHALAAWSLTSSTSQIVVAEATNVKLQVASTWRFKKNLLLYVAATVKYHGARPWHQFDFSCSCLLLLPVVMESERQKCYKLLACLSHSSTPERRISPNV